MQRTPGQPASTEPMLPPQYASAPTHDRLATAIIAAAIILFVGTGSAVLSVVVARFVLGGAPLDRAPLIALLLNVALILFGWRRDAARRARETAAALAEQRALGLANADPLTGLRNRRALAEDAAALQLQGARRQRTLALLKLDLDRFRAVNDLHGPAIGDQLLRQVTAEIEGAMPAGGLAARFGSDEFAIVALFEPNYPETIERIAERLLARMTQPFVVSGLQLALGMSIGIARADRDGSSVDAMLRAADIAMLQTKRGGGNSFAWFDQSMEDELRARTEIETGLRAAIPAHGVKPWFEQLVELSTGRLAGFEVLARWDRPGHGVLPPASFMQVAEETGQAGELSLSVIAQALMQARDWDSSLSLSVNLAPAQLRDPWLPQKLMKLCTDTGFAMTRLEVDITEAALIDNLALAQSIVTSLKNQGIRVALDDFGTGYSSIAHLRALPFDRLKIDTSFVRTMAQSPESVAVVTAIARLGESLNIAVAAEGIEDAMIAQRLAALGCGLGQGYLYGQPVDAAAVRAMLAERRLIARAA